MEEMMVYIANLRKYNEGELVGDWFSPPIDWEQVKERVGLDNEYEEYAIHDYQLPFDIDEYTPIQEVNRLCEMVLELEPEVQSELRAFLFHFDSVEEIHEKQDDIIHYPDCESMSDVAHYLIEETGALGEIPAQLQHYIDYEAYGRDLEIEGNFIVTGRGIFEVPY